MMTQHNIRKIIRTSVNIAVYNDVYDTVDRSDFSGVRVVDLVHDSLHQSSQILEQALRHKLLLDYDFTQTKNT